MSRKLGQIIAVRKNTWMIRIPMGCAPQTRQRNYYNRTVHGSLRQAQKFLGKKVNELGAYIERDSAKIRLDQYLDQWLKTVKSRICSKTYEGYESLLAKYIRPSPGEEASGSDQTFGRPNRLSTHAGSWPSPRTECKRGANL